METTLQKPSTENFVKDIRRKSRRLHSSEQKTLIVPVIRGETSIAEICHKHGIAQSMLYKWNKEFLDSLRCFNFGTL